MATHVYTTQESPYPLDQVTKEHFPWYIQQILAGKTVAVSSLADLPAKAAKDRESCRLFGVKSNLSLPLSVGSGPPIGLLGFNTTRTERDWPDELVKRLQLIAQMFANGLQRKRMEGRLKQRLHEIQELKQRLEQENFYLRDEVALLHDHSGIICESRVMKFVLHQLEQVARTDSTVLIAGETGTGKELLAREIHALSSRKGRTLVVVNCASLSPTLIESELFGREKGAYTGAMTRMAGRFEIADGSTLFLDEIGELPLDLQSKLLRVIEEGSLERLGSTRIIHVNVRIIAATNRDLSEEVERGAFRQDLFYRLNVFPLTMPPLRERREDIPPLIWAFVRNFEKKMGKHIEKIPGRSMEALQNWSWPGNVRELRNIIEHAMIITRGKTLEVVMPKVNADEHAEEQHISLESAERKHIQAVLQRCGWRISGAGGAAEALGLKRTTLQSKMKKLGIERPVY
jgi:transcriptional regulator with GAF, ATPase, and Fis domain